MITYNKESFAASVQASKEFQDVWCDKLDALIREWCIGGSNEHYAQAVGFMAKYLISLLHEAAKLKYPGEHYGKMPLSEFIKVFADYQAQVIARAERNIKVIEKLKAGVPDVL